MKSCECSSPKKPHDVGPMWGGGSQGLDAAKTGSVCKPTRTVSADDWASLGHILSFKEQNTAHCFEHFFSSSDGFYTFSQFDWLVLNGVCILPRSLFRRPPPFSNAFMDSFLLFHPSILPSHLCWAERVTPWTSCSTRETNSLLNVHVLRLWEGAGVEHSWHRESNTTMLKGAGWESNPQPSCCEAAVLNTAPPRQPKQHLCFNNSC